MKVQARGALTTVYAVLTAWLVIPALAALTDSGLWTGGEIFRTALLMLVPAVMLTLSVSSREHSIAWSVLWTWSFIFLGLAPAYQLSIGALPWGALLSEQLVAPVQWVVLTGYAAAIAAFGVATRATRRRAFNPRTSSDTGPLRRAATGMIWVHTTVSVTFIVLMGAALFAGRSAFSLRLVELSTVPGAGTIYFLSTAGAIATPAVAITLRNMGVPIHGGLMALSVAASFIVTNPLIGSRFLTGSFLVAVTAALLTPTARRWLPAGIILLFVTIFPTLDLLRGDGTGATAVEITDPSTTLTSLDFDGFEMLYRAVSLNGETAHGLAGTADLLVAPLLRWVPILSDTVQGNATGPVVARSTGMGFTNVSMPLWGEAFHIGSWAGVVVVFAIVGVVLAATRRPRSLAGVLLEAPVAAVLFIVLRGSLYEVLGYMLAAMLICWWLASVDNCARARVAPRYRPTRPAAMPAAPQ